MMKQDRPIRLRMDADTYYVWVGGSCDYAHKERAGGGAYIMEKDDKVIDTYVTADTGTTEFRMMLTVMLHAMATVPKGSTIVFLTNVSYIQNFDKEPTDSSANADLIRECIAAKRRHNSAVVRIIPYHKYHQLPDTHDMAHEAMLKLRNRKD
jgi:hypothetical protein